MALHSGRIGVVILVAGLMIFGGIFAATITDYRSAKRARLLADLHRTDIPAPRYAIETSGPATTAGDSAWRAYCERERLTLIEEARAAAQ